MPSASGRWLATCYFVLIVPATANAASGPSSPGFTVQNASVHIEGGVYLLDALIDFDFSAESIEAMNNGVSLTILLDVEILKPFLFWKKTVLQQQSRYRVGVHALSKRYVVRHLNSGETRTFRTVDEMASALGMVDDLPLFEKRLLNENEDYRARVRARLDVEALPSPLRPLAYISPEWRLGGAWFEWPLDR
ncbi:MAG: DUF4390 domain-containing protein [Gammaproteobacteria bacterium]|nr:DUF4390 domain-containing protein [Gammaproteobacteria bacterium]